VASSAHSFVDFSINKRYSLIKKYALIEEKRILDVGCGNGFYTITLANEASIVVGIDINRVDLRKAHLNKSQVNRSNVHFVLMSAEALAFRNNSFNVVTSIENLEHINNQELALSNIKDVLEARGHVVLFVPNKFYPFETHGMRIENFFFDCAMVPAFSFAPNFIRKRYETARIYTFKAIQCLLEKEGFEVNVIDFMFPPLDNLKKLPLKLALRKILLKLETTPLRIFGISVFCMATKKLVRTTKTELLSYEA
jgi:ubiquinone/menaquinone biosynthesis C-methylase UbiE